MTEPDDVATSCGVSWICGVFDAWVRYAGDMWDIQREISEIQWGCLWWHRDMQPVVSSTVPTHPTIIITVNAIIKNVLQSLDLFKKGKGSRKWSFGWRFQVISGFDIIDLRNLQIGGVAAFYRTQVSLGFSLWVSVSLCHSSFWNLTNVFIVCCLPRIRNLKLQLCPRL